jgi:ribosome biogenesis GTPase A
MLLTVDDIGNQEAPKIARKYDPEGTRTIGMLDEMIVLTITGVLTKADLVPNKEHDQWLQILRNSGEHRLIHGYYVTRQLTTEQREEGFTTLDETGESEDKYFERHPVWCRVNASLRGTSNLTNALSRHLAIMIQDRYCLPQTVLT